MQTVIFSDEELLFSTNEYFSSFVIDHRIVGCLPYHAILLLCPKFCSFFCPPNRFKGGPSFQPAPFLRGAPFHPLHATAPPVHVPPPPRSGGWVFEKGSVGWAVGLVPPAGAPCACLTWQDFFQGFGCFGWFWAG